MVDELSEKPQKITIVIPAQAGIHTAITRLSLWIPAYAGMTGVFTTQSS